MRLTYPLDDSFSSKTYVRVLRALHQLPSGWSVSTRDAARRASTSHPTASRVLTSLVDQGLVQVRRGPLADLFQLNRLHVLVEKLEEMFAWEDRLLLEFVTFVRAELERDGHVVTAAFLFGSAARGDMSETSDIDLGLICAPEQAPRLTERAESLATLVRERYGNRLNVLIETSAPEHLRQGRRPRDRLWRQILNEGIAVVPLRNNPANG